MEDVEMEVCKEEEVAAEVEGRNIDKDGKVGEAKEARVWRLVELFDSK